MRSRNPARAATVGTAALLLTVGVMPMGDAAVRKKRTAPRVAVATVDGPARSTAPIVTSPVPAAAAGQDSLELFDAVNRIRAGAGLAPLQWHPELAGLAREWSATMTQIGLAHRPASQMMVGAGLGRFAENVAWGSGVTWQELLDGLLRSPGHRANILSPAFTQAGFEVLVANGEVFITQNFGGP